MHTNMYNTRLELEKCKDSVSGHVPASGRRNRPPSHLLGPRPLCPILALTKELLQRFRRQVGNELLQRSRRKRRSLARVGPVPLRRRRRTLLPFCSPAGRAPALIISRRPQLRDAHRRAPAPRARAF